MRESFKVLGKVQGIMFRKTFIRACHRRGLSAGATNSPIDRGVVTCSVEGEDQEVYKLKNDLLELKELNSWGAHVESVVIMDEFINIDSHEVTTDNLESFEWSDGVQFFL